LVGEIQLLALQVEAAFVLEVAVDRQCYPLVDNLQMEIAEVVYAVSWDPPWAAVLDLTEEAMLRVVDIDCPAGSCSVSATPLSYEEGGQKRYWAYLAAERQKRVVGFAYVEEFASYVPRFVASVEKVFFSEGSSSR
jgi:hypothetical protein